MADALGLDATQRRDVEFAALLHDVGKIRVPKTIITKPGPLDDEEWTIIRRHTIDGEAMLCQVGGALVEVGRIVRSSHERYDGAAIPTVSPAMRSRSNRGSSRPATPTAR